MIHLKHLRGLHRVRVDSREERSLDDGRTAVLYGVTLIESDSAVPGLEAVATEIGDVQPVPTADLNEGEPLLLSLAVGETYYARVSKEGRTVWRVEMPRAPGEKDSDGWTFYGEPA